MEAPTALPRTTHMLKYDQRVRLMRSSRKVEALLDETLLFVDSPHAAAFAFPVPPNPINGIKANENNTCPVAFIYAATPRSSSLGVHMPPPHGSTSHAHTHPLLAVCVPPSASSSLSFPFAFDRPRTSSDSSLAPVESTQVTPAQDGAHAEREVPHRARLSCTLYAWVWDEAARARTHDQRAGQCEFYAEAGLEPESRALVQACAIRPRSRGRFRLPYSTLSSGAWVRIGKPPAQSAFSAPSTSVHSNHASPAWNAPLWPTPPFVPSSPSSSSSYSSTPPQTSSFPVRYDRGTPVRGVSYAVFPPIPAPDLQPLSSSSPSTTPSDARPGYDARTRSAGARGAVGYVPPVGYSTDEPYNGAPSSHAPRSGSPSPACAAHVPVPFDVYAVLAAPQIRPRVVACRGDARGNCGTRRTEKVWSGEWVTGVDGSGKRVQSMDDVARLRGLQLR
ncbi:hypothetical protein C8R44DRAFT_871650 [Mycena epipterygia]|nr:hypothetical protein C8R44DRAFT_871650 [Mycena epipterygia]